MFAFDDINQFTQDNSAEVSNSAVKGQISPEVNDISVPTDIKLKIDFQFKNETEPTQPPVNNSKTSNDAITGNLKSIANDIKNFVTNNSTTNNNISQTYGGDKIISDYLTQVEPSYVQNDYSRNEEITKNQRFDDIVNYYKTETQRVRNANTSNVENSNSVTNTSTSAQTNTSVSESKPEIQTNNYFSDLATESSSSTVNSNSVENLADNDNISINKSNDITSVMNSIRQKDETIRIEKERAQTNTIVQAVSTNSDPRIKELESKLAAIMAEKSAPTGSNVTQLTQNTVNQSQGVGTETKKEVKEPVDARTLIQQGGDINTMLLMQIVQLLSGKLKLQNSDGW